MFKISFYRDASGKAPVREHMDGLPARRDKDGRVKLNKLLDHMKILSEYGTRAGEPYMKHTDGDIWELRPMRDRIFLCGRNGAQVILLHHFVKKPQRETDHAKRHMRDFVERSGNDEQE